MAFVFAYTYTVVFAFSLPRTDGAYGIAAFEDPFVIPVMMIGALVYAIVVFPFFYFALRNRPLIKSSKFIALIVLAELLVVTPINFVFGLLGSYLAFGVGICFARAFTTPLPLALDGGCEVSSS